jgi:hypothetical protein
VPGRVREELQNVVQLLQCFLRAVGLEMRAAEESLKGKMDARRLRARRGARDAGES